ncbi:MAG TPA: DinB family protein [Flavitalea sp.]|nr:DinB family protein [Flavitalea sp.]
MGRIIAKSELLAESGEVFDKLTLYCNQLPENIFFGEIEGKWTIAQHVQHLVISTKTATAAYAIPKFFIRLIGGRPGRSSQTFDELTEKYQMKLNAGGKASGRYVPANISRSSGKEVLQSWKLAASHYLHVVDRKWTDNKLDSYQVPHPLLGRITLRELCYFTLFHTAHHLKGIKAQTMLLG